MKKKTIKAKWCPLTGPDFPDCPVKARKAHIAGKPLTDWESIYRARIFWQPFKKKENTEKAGKIYEKWDKIYRGSRKEKINYALSMYHLSPEDKCLDEALRDFRDFGASVWEVLSIAAIHAARIERVPKLAENLLTIAEKNSPNATLGEKTRKQRSDYARKGIELRREQTNTRHNEWLDYGKSLRSKNPGMSTRSISKLTCKKLSVSNSFQSVYKLFLKNNV